MHAESLVGDRAVARCLQEWSSDADVPSLLGMTEQGPLRPKDRDGQVILRSSDKEMNYRAISTRSSQVITAGLWIHLHSDGLRELQSEKTCASRSISAQVWVKYVIKVKMS